MSAATAKTPTITVTGTEVLIRTNGHPRAKELTNELPGRRWAAKRNAWAIVARPSEELTELITATGATVIDPEGVLSPGYVAPVVIDPSPFYFGVNSPTEFMDWEVGQVLRVFIKDTPGTPGVMWDRGLAKVNPEGNAWLTVVSAKTDTHEHLGKFTLTSEGKGRLATDAEVEAHLGAEDMVESAEAPTEAPKAPAEATVAVALALAETPVEAPVAVALEEALSLAPAPCAEVEAPAATVAPVAPVAEAPQATGPTTMTITDTEVIIVMGAHDAVALHLVKAVNGVRWNAEDQTWRAPLAPSAVLNTFARHVNAEVVDPSGKGPVSPAAYTPKPEEEEPRGEYSFSDSNSKKFPWWKVGSVLKASAPTLEPSEGPLIQTPISLHGPVMPSDKLLCIATLTQEKSRSLPGSAHEWDFETYGTARLATTQEIAAWEKKRSPKN